MRKRKREFTAVYPYRSSLAALASPRQGWAESKTANSQQVQPTHAPTRGEPDVSRAQKMQCIITEPTSCGGLSLADTPLIVGSLSLGCACCSTPLCLQRPVHNAIEVFQARRTRYSVQRSQRGLQRLTESSKGTEVVPPESAAGKVQKNCRIS